MRLVPFLAVLASAAGPAFAEDAVTLAGIEAALTSCRAALAETANRPDADISVVEVLATEAGIEVTLGLEGAEEPWACAADPAGAVVEVMYLGEG